MRKTKRFRQGVGRLLLLLVAMLAFISPGRAYDAWYVRYGTPNTNDWQDVTMTQSGDERVATVTVTAGQQFVIKANSDEYGLNSGHSATYFELTEDEWYQNLSKYTSGTHPFQFPNSKTYTVHLKLDNSTPKDVKIVPQNGGGDDNTPYYFHHDFGGAGWSNEQLTGGSNGVYTTTFTLNAVNNFFTISAKNALNWNSPDFWNTGSSNNSEITSNGTISASTGSNKGVWIIKEAGTYTLTIDTKNNKFTVKGFPDITRPEAADLSIRGSWVEDWADDDTKNWTPVNSFTNGVYFFPLGYWFQSGSGKDNKDLEFQVKIGNQIYRAQGTSYEIGTSESDATAFASYKGSNGCFKVKDCNRQRNIYIYIDVKNMKMWSGVDQAPALFVYPRQAREAGNDWSAWTEPTVYVTAGYLNNNKFVPDWEMEKTAEGVYELNNVVLRGLTGGSNTKIQAHILTPNDAHDGTYTEEIIDLGTIDGALENKSGANVGRAFDLKLDGSNFTATSNKLNGSQDTRVPFLSFVGVRYEQENKGKTPNNLVKVAEGKTLRGTEIGWQESWVLYDDNGQPMRDVNGRYIYSTQWPPKNKIHFNAKKEFQGTTSEIGIASDGMVFRMDEEHNTLTGAEWKNTLAEIDDKYSKIDHKNGNAIAAGQWLDSSMKYTRYVVKNVWLLGATKIWTGWGAENVMDKDNGNDIVLARWNDHANWGYGSEKGNNSGTQIAAKQAYDMNIDAGNFMFNKPTYFNTVEFFIPMKNDNEAADDLNGAVFITTQAMGDAQIEAKKTVLGHPEETDLSKANTGAYKPTIDGTSIPDDHHIVNVRITRYFVNGSDINDPNTWKPAMEVASGSNDYYWDYEYKDYSATSQGSFYRDGKKVEGDWIYEPTTLATGKYFYGMKIEYYTEDDPSKIKNVQVASSNFTIMNTEYKPNTVPLQLVRITKKEYLDNMLDEKTGIKSIRDAFKKLSKQEQDYILANTNEDYEGNTIYFTFRTSENANFYRVVKNVGVTKLNDNDEDGKLNERALIVKLLSTPELMPFIQWTSDYWVHVFDAGNYAEQMEANKFEGLVTDYDSPDKMKVAVKLCVNNDQSHELEAKDFKDADNNVKKEYQAFYSHESKLWGKVFTGQELANAGLDKNLLDNRSFDAMVEYSYSELGTGENGQIVSQEYTKPAFGRSETVRPTMPTAVFDSYYFTTEEDPTDIAWDQVHEYYTPDEEGYVTFDVNSAIESINTAITNNEKDPLKVKIHKDQLKHRNLTCNVLFFRPNLSQMILENYDFYVKMNIYHVNGAGEREFICTKRYHSASDSIIANPDYTQKGGPRFKIEYGDMSPEDGVSIQFEIEKVWYIERDKFNADGSVNALGLKKFNGYKSVNEWENTLTCNSQGRRENFGGEGNNTKFSLRWNYNDVDAYHCNYTISDIHIDNEGDLLGGSDKYFEGATPDNDVDKTWLKPVYYMVEALKNDGSEHHYSDYLLVYDRTKNWFHSEYAAWPFNDAEAPVVYEKHPFLEDWNGRITVLKNVIQAPETINDYKFYLAPVYFFVHYPGHAHEPVISGGMTEYDKLVNEPDSKSNGPARVVVNKPTADREIVAVHGGFFEQPLNMNDMWTGIDSVIGDGDGEAVYYNMQGVRVANPGKGLYIRVKDGRSEKVIL